MLKNKIFSEIDGVTNDRRLSFIFWNLKASFSGSAFFNKKNVIELNAFRIYFMCHLIMGHSNSAQAA